MTTAATGATFILRNGRGKKRRYNGETAEVVVPDGSASGGTGGPRPGGWVTVKIRRAEGGDDSGEGEIVKWRSHAWDLVNNNGSSPAAASCAGQQRDASTNTNIARDLQTSHESPTDAGKSTEATAEELASAMLGVLTSQGVLTLPSNNEGSAVTLSTLKLKLKDTAVRVLRGEHVNPDPDACLERMPRDVWTKIFGFFVDTRTNFAIVNGEFDDSAPFWGKMRHANNYEDEIKEIHKKMKQVVVLPSERVLSFPSVCSLIRSLSAVSQVIEEETKVFIKSSLIEADFVAIEREKALGCVLWLTRLRANLLSIRIRTSPTDLGILSHLFRLCNTETLKSFEVKLAERWHDDGGMIKRAWHAMQDGDDIMDVTIDTATRSPEEMLDDMNVLPETKVELLRETSEGEFYANVSSNSPNIEVLRVKVGIDRGNTHLPAIMPINSIKYLELSFYEMRDLTWYGESLKGQIREEARSNLVSKIHQLPRLRCLHLSAHQLLAKIRIKSDSLEMIDVSSSGKLARVVECICPKLKKFVGRAGAGGAGLCPNDTERLEIGLSQLPALNLSAEHGFKGFKSYGEDCMVHYL